MLMMMPKCPDPQLVGAADADDVSINHKSAGANDANDARPKSLVHTSAAADDADDAHLQLPVHESAGVTDAHDACPSALTLNWQGQLMLMLCP